METRTIGGETYTYVQRQKSDIIVYRSENAYLRIGSPSAINQQLQAHKHLGDYGFPVPELIGEGIEGREKYFIEKSLGERRFLNIFEDETKRSGHTSDESFSALIALSDVFLKAQNTARQPRDIKTFAQAIHLSALMAELPKFSEGIRSLFDQAISDVVDFPFVTIHGDFNPANIYPSGIIDFEDMAVGPLGYDIACATSTHEWFPTEGDYEYLARYIFTKEQRERYIAHFDAQLQKVGAPPLSKHWNSFGFFRAVWLTARMGKWPKLQKYRYDLFQQKYLS